MLTASQHSSTLALVANGSLPVPSPARSSEDTAQRTRFYPRNHARRSPFEKRKRRGEFGEVQVACFRSRGPSGTKKAPTARRFDSQSVPESSQPRGTRGVGCSEGGSAFPRCTLSSGRLTA